MSSHLTRGRAARVRIAGIAGAVALPAALLAVAAPAAAAPPGCDNRNNNTIAKLLECVTVEGVRAHQQAFQEIADSNGGTRASGTPGYDESADYVADQAAQAGLTVTTQEFEFPFFQLNSEALERVSPDPVVFVSGSPFIAVGIPAGGLFTGAEGIKTAAQQATYGGTAGIAFDPCYHQACDTFDNVSLQVLDQNADAIAYPTLTLANGP